ncbi:MAG: TRAP transporter small permease [Maritimibacter sp.]|uniref:TRAP transporter small permease n=1 Tax=Maritimibacter sp. TaxID=2003363 RepID=UPI001D5948D4|nr:TRAP transporter small permease [Maritimibacter sp.]MBL6426760.1 TRAP transporter small permease [Maritimibacter sp.]
MIRFVGALDRLIGWIAAAALATCFALLTFSVFARYAAPTLQPQWVFEVSVFLLVWAILLGVARIEKRGEHIRVDFLLMWLGPRGRRAAQIAALLAALGVSGLFVYSGVIVVQDGMMWDERTESALRLPFWIFYLALPASFAIHFIFIVSRIALVLQGQAAPHPHGLSD